MLYLSDAYFDTCTIVDVINFQESSSWYFRSTAASGARSDWVPSQHQGENKQTNKKTNKQTNKQHKGETNLQKFQKNIRN